jgi:hypothetical protein
MNLALKASVKYGGYVLPGVSNRKLRPYFFRADSAKLINSPFPRAALSAEAGRSLSPRLS